jgi:hypothetical protein
MPQKVFLGLELTEIGIICQNTSVSWLLQRFWRKSNSALVEFFFQVNSSVAFENAFYICKMSALFSWWPSKLVTDILEGESAAVMTDSDM